MKKQFVSTHKICSVRQYAQKLGISRQAVLKQINAKKVPAIKVDHFYIILPKWIPNRIYPIQLLSPCIL
jgi:hypothetical protein